MQADELISFDPHDPGGYDPRTFGQPCRECGSDLWVVTSLALICSGRCYPRRMVAGEEQLGWFDAKEWREKQHNPPRLMTHTNEPESRGYRPITLKRLVVRDGHEAEAEAEPEHHAPRDGHTSGHAPRPAGQERKASPQRPTQAHVPEKQAVPVRESDQVQTLLW